jgi:hypothetical protein
MGILRFVFDKQKKYHAYHFPTWSNYLKFSSDSYNVQYSVLISCIFFLEQSVDIANRLYLY